MIVRFDIFSLPRLFRSVFCRYAVILLLSICYTSSVHSADENRDAASHIPAKPELADVIVDGRLVMKVRGTASIPAARRAAEIRRKIIDAARDDSIPAEAVSFKDMGDRTLVLAGDKQLFFVLDFDGAIEGISHQLLAEIRQKRLQEVIAEYRHDRSPRVLATRSAYALLALLVAAGLIFGFRKAFRQLTKIVDRRLQARLKDLEVKSARFIRSTQLAKIVRSLIDALFFALVALTLYFSLNFALGLFPWTRGFAIWLFGLILNPLKSMGAGIVSTIPNLVWLTILFFITRYILGMIKAFLRNVEIGVVSLASFEQEWAMPTYRILRMVIVVFAVVVAYPHIPGSGSEAFKGIGVILGLMISLGSTSIIGNIIAGYSLTYRRPFKIGDRVNINGKVGEITEIQVMSTRMRSPKNEEIVVPNTEVLNGEVVNYSTLARQQGVILHTTVGIGYETPWRQVEAMLKLAASRTGGLLKQPEPFVLAKELGDFAVTYELNVHCNDTSSIARTYSELHYNVLDVFNEYGIAIMTPAYEADPPEPKVVPEDQWYVPPATPPAETKNE